MPGRIYISGPMSGKHLWNFPAFFSAERVLRRDGWDVVNPARIDEEVGDVVVTRGYSPISDDLYITNVELTGTFDFRKAIDRDLELIDGCTAIYLLRGWEKSLGAQIELDRALRLGLQVLVEGGAEVPAYLQQRIDAAASWAEFDRHFEAHVAFATDREELPSLNHFAYLGGDDPFVGVGDDDPVIAGVDWEELDDEDPGRNIPELERLLTEPTVLDDETNPKDLVGLKKPPVDLVPPAALLHMSRVMGLGAEKYGAYNWREKKVRSTVYLAAAMRHILQALDGEDLDPESGQPHEAHAAACMAILLDAQASGNLIDDRPTPGPAARVIEGLTLS